MFTKRVIKRPAKATRYWEQLLFPLSLTSDLPPLLSLCHHLPSLVQPLLLRRLVAWLLQVLQGLLMLKLLVHRHQLLVARLTKKQVPRQVLPVSRDTSWLVLLLLPGSFSNFILPDILPYSPHLSPFLNLEPLPL
jgi:hypothetical protein